MQKELSLELSLNHKNCHQNTDGADMCSQKGGKWHENYGY
nr:MAG TPA: hypothetical protein [Caudoviricetes sp.]